MVPLIAMGRTGIPAIQSMLAHSVVLERQGELQGMLMSLISRTAVLGPILFDWIFAPSQPAQPGAVWLVCALLYALTLPIILRLPKAAG